MRVLDRGLVRRFSFSDYSERVSVDHPRTFREQNVSSISQNRSASAIAENGLTRLDEKAMQRTASQPAFYLVSVRHPPFDCESRFTRLAVADLVSR